MRKRKAIFVAVLGASVVLAVTFGLVSVSALGGLSSLVDVEIQDPLNGTVINVFSSGGQVPASLPIEVEALVTMNPTPPDVETELTGVDFTLNGTLDTGARTVTNADYLDNGVKTDNISASQSEWVGVIDLAKGSFGVPARGVLPALVSNSTIRALAAIRIYYPDAGVRVNASDFDDYDAINITTQVFDSAPVDTNGNNKPDADGLLDFSEGLLTGTGSSGGQVFTFWADMGGSLRGTIVETSLTLDSPGGAIFVDVTAPTLSALQIADSGLAAFDIGRLVVTVATRATDLLDGPADVDPVGEFDLVDAMTMEALSPPANVFALINILVQDLDAMTPTWSAIETLPGGLMTTAALSGPGIGAALNAGDDVRGYTYNTTNSQDMLGNIVDDGDEVGWAEVAVVLEDNDSAVRATAAAGDDTITVTLGTASIIIGSNATPALTAGGGGGGSTDSCFIATAAYGTPLAGDIDALRGVRDRFMLTSTIGTAFADLYYSLSPTVAKSVANHEGFKGLVRAVLQPVVIASRSLLAMPALIVLAPLAGLAYAMHRIRRRRQKA